MQVLTSVVEGLVRFPSQSNLVQVSSNASTLVCHGENHGGGPRLLAAPKNVLSEYNNDWIFVLVDLLLLVMA